MDKDLDHLQKLCTGIALSPRCGWEPGLVSSLLTLCFSPLLCSGHPLFSSVLWSPQQKHSLLTAHEHSLHECGHRRICEYIFLSPFPLCPCVVLAAWWRGACHTTNHGQGHVGGHTLLAPFIHSCMHSFIDSFNNR